MTNEVCFLLGFQGVEEFSEVSIWQELPEKSLRPSFESLRQTLSGEASLLLQWREEDSAGQSQAARLLTAPLEAGKDLHSDLQETYLQKH